MTDFDLGWVVGIIEGEGTFTLKPKGRQTTICVVQSENGLEVLEKLKSITDMGNITGPYSYPSRNKSRPYYVWTIGNYKHCKMLLDQMYPYFSNKRKIQCDKLLTFLKTKKL